jgi:group I intron endonuclease
MYHYVYKTTNNVTGKIYIGAHSSETLDDGYLGSGKALKDAIKKYGKENFSRSILEFFDTREEAFKKESDLVTEDFIKEDTNYNMCSGGLGSTVKSEKFKKIVSHKLKGRIFTEEHSRKKSLAQTGSKNHRYGKPNPNNPKLSGKDNGMFGKNHSDESKKLISQNRKLTKVEYTPELIAQLSSACKGKLWYNDGKISKRFKEGEQPDGFVKGRILQ